MKHIIISGFIVALGFSAKAATNDLPKKLWTCQESVEGALVQDGAKILNISKDQFGVLYLTAVQKDQFFGNKALLKDLVVNKEQCQGYVPCELYKLEATELSVEFFINILPGQNQQSGHLELATDSETLSVDFLCKKH